MPVGPWDSAFELECRGCVDALIAGDQGERPWQQLLVAIAPHVETWAADNWVLRRWRLVGEDDVRAVLVTVLGRLRQAEFGALRKLSDASDSKELDEQREAVEGLTRLTCKVDDAPEADGGDASTGTPLRALLLTMVRHAAADHVRYRLGWTDAGGRRSVGTDAARLSGVPEAGARPPMTDYLTVRKLLDQIAEVTAEFPAPMSAALRMWMHDASYDAIALELELDDGAAARKLVRAAQARLRERFRGEFPALFQ